MLRWLKTHVTREMIRPIVYRTSSRFLYSLIPVLLWYRFINTADALHASQNGLSTAFALMTAVFLACAWLAWLRIDGLRIPALPAKLFRRKQKPDVLCADMIDHVDEPILQFEDLEEDEQNIALLVVNAVCAVLYLAASFLV